MMVERERVLQKFLNNPVRVRYSKIEGLLLNLGFEKVEAKGSHKKFKHWMLERDLIVPIHNNDCKSFYKKLIAKAIKQILNEN